MADDGNPLSLSNADRDWIIRTVAGEDASQPAAIASVIKNRMQDGRWGSSAKAVVLNPDQFSMWNGLTGAAGGKGANDIGSKLDPTSDQYKKIGSTVDDVFSGKAKDPTNGALNYYNPDQSSPDWGPSMAHPTKIGSQIYGTALNQGGAPTPGTTLTSIPDFTGQGAPAAAATPSWAQRLQGLSSTKPGDPGAMLSKGLAMIQGKEGLSGEPTQQPPPSAPLMQAPPISNRSVMLGLAPQLGQQLSGYAPQPYGGALAAPLAQRQAQLAQQQQASNPYGTTLTSMQAGFGMMPPQLAMLMNPYLLDQYSPYGGGG